MPEFFPADVSLRVEGDLTDAQALFPAARNLLFRALRRKELSGQDLVKMFQPLPDGSLLAVTLAQNLKLLYVQPAPRKPAPVPLEVEEEHPSLEALFSIYTMLSGAVRGFNFEGPGTPSPPVIYNAGIIDPELPVLGKFHPDIICSAAYTLPLDWQFMEKLAVNLDGSNAAGGGISFYPKPSMFSGAMKRMVQAILGIGRSETDTEDYFTEAIPTTDTTDRINVYHNYDWHWERTHGLTRVGNGYWIVEISKLNGIVAMPMNVFRGTDTTGYRNWLLGFGDFDTVAVIDEFGGLPIGTLFPEGTDLDDALADGKLIRLAEAADLLDFYHDVANNIDKKGMYAGSGWAFSASGVAAINTCNWYKDIAYAHPSSTWPLALYYTEFPNLNFDDRFMRSEYWRIDIALSDINTGFIDIDHPAGFGSALITQLESRLCGSGWMDTAVYEQTWPSDKKTIFYYINGNYVLVPKDAANDELDFFSWDGFYYNPLDYAVYGGPYPNTPPAYYPIWYSDAVMYAFFVGETPELLRQNIPYFTEVGPNLAILWGTSLDPRTLRVQPTAAGLVAPACQTWIPAFCREGYAFGWAIYNSDVLPDTPGYAKGFFTDHGIVDFTPNEGIGAYYAADLGKRTYWFKLGPVRFGVISNCGQRSGFYACDGANPVIDTYTPPQYMLTSNLVELEIPELTNPTSLTFVGSP